MQMVVWLVMAFSGLVLGAADGLAQRPEIVAQVGHSSYVISLVFSPDSRLFATGDSLGIIKVWNTQSGRLLHTLPGHAGPVTALVFSPDGQTLVSDSQIFANERVNFHDEFSADNMIRVWHVRKGKLLIEVAHIPRWERKSDGTIEEEGVEDVPFAFSPDGILFAAGIDSTIHVWDAHSGSLRRTLRGHTRRLTQLTFSPNGTMLGSSSIEDEGSASAAGPEPEAEEARIIEDRAKLWHVASGRLLFELQGCSSVRFNASGTLIADGRGNICETETGKLLHSLAGHFLMFSPDASAVVLQECPDSHKPPVKKTCELKGYDALSGNLMHSMRYTPSDYRHEIAFSHDGRTLVMKDQESELPESKFAVWDMRDWRLLYTHIDANSTFGTLSPDGNTFAVSHDVVVEDSGDRKCVLELYETRSRKMLAQFPANDNCDELAFSPDGQMLLTYPSYGNSLKLWTVASGELKHAYSGVDYKPNTLTFSADGKLFAVSRDSNFSTAWVEVWETRSGSLVHTFLPRDPDDDEYSKITFTAGSQWLATGDGQLWNVQNGKAVRRIARESVFGGSLYARVIENNEGWPRTELRDIQSNRLLRRIETLYDPPLSAFALSPDGKLLAAGNVIGEDGKTGMELYNVASGRFLRRFEGVKRIFGLSLVFSPDGSLLLAKSIQGSGAFTYNLLFDVKTGQFLTDFRTDSWEDNADKEQAKDNEGEEQTWVDKSGHEKALAFSPDSKMLMLGGGVGNAIELRAVPSGQLLKTLPGLTSKVRCAAFTPDGKILVTGHADTALRLWAVDTGELLATLLSFGEGLWLVLTPDGLFDGSPNAWSRMLWRFSEDTFDVAPAEIFFNELYYPGLLADIFAGERPTATQSIEQKDRRQVRLQLELGEPQGASGQVHEERRVNVRLTVTEAPPDTEHAQGSGVQDVRLFRNGTLVRVWRGDVLKGSSSVVLEAHEIPIVAGDNRFHAYAFNHDNIKSADTELLVKGAEGLKRRGTAYILAVGVNTYADPAYNLRYAVADARAFSQEWQRQQAQLHRYEHIEVLPLYDKDATKANLLRSLAQLAQKAQPEDVVVVFFAGHGTASHHQFYLIPHDLGSTSTLLAHSISDRELEQAFEHVDAGQLLLVIDACYSGRALETEEKRRGPMNSKGLAQLAYEKGMYILTAAQSYQAALESAKLGHGLMTYALVVEGMRQSAADSAPRDGEVLLREWLDYATGRVPELQIEGIKRARRRGLKRELEIEIEKRNIQRPRAFYRRELEAQPLVIARSAADVPMGRQLQLQPKTREESDRVQPKPPSRRRR